MKGLRRYIHAVGPYHYWVFLPCDLNEGITTNICTGNNTRWRKVFTLWPEWRDYDEYNESHIKSLSDLVFTLWPEWRDYDTKIDIHHWHTNEFLPCDLNEGITTYFALCYAICHFIRFYLVTWMKGLRLAGNLTFHGQYQVLFLPCDLNEGITTWALEYPCNLRSLLCFYLVTWMKGLRHIIASTYVLAYTYKVFTLWPEWRDYDPLCRVGHWPAQTCFYLVTWMKGLRRISNSRTTVFISIPFLPCDLNEGITTWITLKPT